MSSHRVERVHQQYDVAVTALVKQARRQGIPIPCKQGCSACCAEPAYSGVYEFGPIIARLRKMSPARKAQIRARVDGWYAAMASAKIDLKADIDHRYRALDVMCPLLDPENKTCSVYEQRPVACRGHYLATEDPADCAARAHGNTTRNLNTLNITGQTLATLVAAYKSGEVLLLATGLLPEILRKMWHLVEDTSLDIDAWITGQMSIPAVSTQTR